MKSKRMKAKDLNDDEGGDYILTGERCWITVKKLSICIRTTDEGVVVNIYPLGREDEDAIASTYAFDDEGDLE